MSRIQAKELSARDSRQITQDSKIPNPPRGPTPLAQLITRMRMRIRRILGMAQDDGRWVRTQNNNGEWGWGKASLTGRRNLNKLEKPPEEQGYIWEQQSVWN